MPHISQKKPVRKTSETIYRELRRLLSRTGKGNMNILDDLFTETERLMLAKRCAVILMVERDVSHYAIWNSLKVSSSTVSRIAKECEEGKHQSVRELARTTHLGSKHPGPVPRQTITFLEAVLSPTSKKMWQSMFQRF